VAAQMFRILSPDSVLLVFFNATEAETGVGAGFTKRIVVDPAKLRRKPYPSLRTSSARSRIAISFASPIRFASPNSSC